jgi:release factor glutamine methyltransferase
VEHPRREATALWAALEGVTPGAVWLRRDRGVDANVVEDFRKAVERRASGIPFAYAIGRASFRHLELKIDSRALIPRPETEGLVDIVLEWARNLQRETCDVQRRSAVVADIGTGSGCIALALATEGDFDRIIAVERSPAAAALARENVALVEPAVSIDVREGDLLGPLAGERCRAIVSNPPYLTMREYEELDPAVRRFEPKEALVSGEDGLHAIRSLLTRAGEVLEPGGLIVLEIDARRAGAVAEIASRSAWRAVSIRHDVFGQPRYLLATAPEMGRGGSRGVAGARRNVGGEQRD